MCWGGGGRAGQVQAWGQLLLASQGAGSIPRSLALPPCSPLVVQLHVPDDPRLLHPLQLLPQPVLQRQSAAAWQRQWAARHGDPHISLLGTAGQHAVPCAAPHWQLGNATTAHQPGSIDNPAARPQQDRHITGSTACSSTTSSNVGWQCRRLTGSRPGNRQQPQAHRQQAREACRQPQAHMYSQQLVLIRLKDSSHHPHVGGALLGPTCGGGFRVWGLGARPTCGGEGDRAQHQRDWPDWAVTSGAADYLPLPWGGACPLHAKRQD